MKRAARYVAALTFSSLTRRIVFLNLIGLLALVIGILYLSQFRAGLIDARAQSLLVQAEIISGAIAASATSKSSFTSLPPPGNSAMPTLASTGKGAPVASSVTLMSRNDE